MKGKVIFRNLVILIVIFLVFPFIGGIKEIKANGWYNTNWSYRIPITITSSTALTDYQVKIELTNSNAANFWVNVDLQAKDVRFTDSDGSSPLPYWIEKWDYTNKKATIWIKVPNIPNGTKTIYLYYGNSSASGIGLHHDPDGGSWYAGDGDNTFIFFDDFEGDTLDTNKWEESEGGQGGYLILGGEIELFIGSYLNQSGGWVYIKTNNSLTENEFVWETRYEVIGSELFSGYPDSTDANRNRIKIDGLTLDISDYGIFDNDSHETIQYFWGDYTDTFATLGTWMKSIETLSSNGSSFIWQTVKEDGTQEFTGSTSVTGTSDKKLVIQCGDEGSTSYYGEMYVDYTFVRKYASSEPTVSLGDEEQPVDLSMTKSISPSSGPYYNYQEVTFTITVTNNSSTQATNVQVTDNLPSGLAYISDDSSGNYDPNTGVWNVGTLNAGENKTLHITAIFVTAGEDLNITNTAKITSCDQGDPVSSNNSSSVTINDVLLSADLNASKSVDKTSVTPGDTITYTIKVNNNGPDAAEGVKVEDSLPAEIKNATFKYSTDGTTWIDGGDWTGEFTFTDSLSCCSTFFIQITGTVDPFLNVSTLPDRKIINRASVSATTHDPDRSNTSRPVTIFIKEPLIQGTAVRTGYFEFFVDRENERWLLVIPGKEYTTGWMPFDRLRDTGSFMSGHYADKRYHLLFDWYSSGRCHLIFNDRREGISIKFAGR